MEISLENKAATLQNDALIAILRVTGREVVIWKAFVEFCRVVSLRGSGKTRIRRKHAWKAKKKWFLVPCLPFCFRPNPKTGVQPFEKKSNPCFRVWPENGRNPLIQNLLEIGSFLPVSH